MWNEFGGNWYLFRPMRIFSLMCSSPVVSVITCLKKYLCGTAAESIHYHRCWRCHPPVFVPTGFFQPFKAIFMLFQCLRGQWLSAIAAASGIWISILTIRLHLQGGTLAKGQQTVSFWHPPSFNFLFLYVQFFFFNGRKSKSYDVNFKDLIGREETFKG